MTVWNNGVWANGFWANGVWYDSGAGVSPGINWAAIWGNGVWAEGVWANDIPEPILLPDVLVGSFGWASNAGNIVDVLKDGLDATFIFANEVGSVVQFTLTDTTMTSITNASIHVRARIG